MFKRYTCWDVSVATKILRPLALEGNEAIFRATHSPISALVVTGTEAHDVSPATERGLLNALSSSERRHAMCVVEGEAGSGKSHLIRWLKVNWPRRNDLPILIERADGTLDGTLRQLHEKLSSEGGRTFDSILPRHKLTDQGQRFAMLLQLGNLCRSGTLSEPVGDEDWCEKHGVSDMLQSEAVRTLWKAPERVLEILTKGADRNSKVARFTARDVLELMQPLAGLRGRNVGPGAIRLAKLLRDEAPAIQSALEGSPGDDEPDIAAVAPNTTRLLAALNSRLNLAIQSAMGISGATLQKMFREFRSDLKKKGSRLVLLLEDLTGAQGLDQELLYVLQERSTTQEQFCDLVSVVGITPAYYRQYIAPQANVVQRITHHVRFGDIQGSFQAVSSLEHPSEQFAFAARYLRALRAGIEEIDQAAAEEREVANRCERCEYREECHRAFGHVDNVGLYPLSEKAIDRMFNHLRDPKGTMFLQTPRALIQAVIAPSIAAEPAIRTGIFPVPTVETEWHLPSMREVRGLAHELIEKSPEELRERLRLTVAWWGDGGLPIQGDTQGEWAGVPDGIFQAWDLLRPAMPTVSPHAPPAGVPETRPPQPHTESEAEKPAGPQRGTAVVKEPPKPPKRTSTKPRIDLQFERLQNWKRTGKIEDDGFWHERAEAFIKKIPWKAEDTPQWFTDEGLGEVRLQGSGKTDFRNIVIPCAQWAARGLEWSARLEHRSLAPQEHDVATHAIALFAQNIRRIVLEWISARLPEVQQGTPWQFESTVVQVLLSRAWLRGETHPGAPLVEQWRVILSDDSPGAITRGPGTGDWNSAVARLAGDFQLHKRLRSLCDCSDGIANVAFVGPAIRMLAHRGEFSPFPESIPEQPVKTKWLNALVSSALLASRALAELPPEETGRLRDLATGILDTVGPTGFAVYLARAENAFRRVRQDLPDLAAGELANWFRLYEPRQGLLKAGPGSEHNRLQDFLTLRGWEALPEDAPIPTLLDYAIQAPVETLELVHALVKDTDSLVKSLVDYLEQDATVASDTQDAQAVVEFGRRVAKKAAELKEAIL
jgi:hypothetical protein